MLTLLWNISAAIRGYLRLYMPTNRVLDWLRTPQGLKWAVPLGLLAVPGYLAGTAIVAQFALRPGLGWLNVLVFLCFWNAAKFTSMATLSLPMLMKRFVASARTSS